MIHKKKRKKYTKKRREIVLRIKMLLFCAVLVLLVCGYFRRDALIRMLRPGQTVETTAETANGTEGESAAPDAGQPEEDSIEDTAFSRPVLSEEVIYTFLQGPRAWGSKTPWSGAWCEEVLAGQKFSVFGCGLCDLANIYSTLSPYECSPVDMFYYAKEVSGYSPGAGYGAIDWGYLKETLNHAGFSCEIRDKDETYEEFCEVMENSVTAIVLVSSRNDSTYWKDTEGHYVNIWSYNSETEEVFLADSGNPEHNRTWIPLRYVYDAQKTSGAHQYLTVDSYDEEKNTWKYSGIEGDWTIPEYYIPKKV